MIQFTKPIGNFSATGKIGTSGLQQKTVAKGTCPYCNHQSFFSQIGEGVESETHGKMIGLECNGCNSILSASIDERKIFPNPTPEKIKELPENVAKYYDEAVDCIGTDAPNAAAAMFRKTIEAVCEDYGVTEIDLDDSIYDMIQKMADEGHITEEHRKGLLALKDAGNDGVHLNDNDPDLHDAKQLQGLVESVLTATVVARHRFEKTRESFPNPHTED